MTINRRQFSRILFQSEAELFTPSGEHTVNVIDISLKGALVRPESKSNIATGTPCTLKLHLAARGTLIRMEATVVHHEGPYLGLSCQEIDLDSLTHLRRLVELNLGDESLLQRELSALLVSEAPEEE